MNHHQPVSEKSSTGVSRKNEHSEHDERSRKPRRISDMSQGPGLLEMVAGDEPEEEGEQEKLGGRSSSIIKFYPDCCRCCVRTSEPVDADAPFMEQLQNFFECPPHGTYGRILLCILICVSLWGLIFCLCLPVTQHDKDDNIIATTNPGWFHGPIMALGIVEITGLLSGILLKKFLNLPPLLGPLILGILYYNTEAINVFNWMKAYNVRNCNKTDEHCFEEGKKTINNWVKPIRVIALGIILTRAGLELSPKQLSKLKGIVPMLAFGPCIMEAMTCAIASYLFFNVMVEEEALKMSLAMCFVGGFAIAAVSPAVVVPGALSLKKGGYGVVKGVPTLLIAASSIDDVLAISIYTIALGFAIKPLKEDDEWQKYCAGALGIGIGMIHGCILGMILHFLPNRNSKYKAENRLLLLLLINFTSVMGYEETFFNGAGSISVLVTSLIAGFGWRSQAHWKRPMKKIERTLAHMWVLWVPLIFGTIGKEIDFTAKPFERPNIFKIFGVIFISISMRCLTAFLVAGFGGKFNIRERIFIALSWVPKATVQAALAPLVLTRAAEAKRAAENSHVNNKEGLSEAYNAQLNAEIVVNIAIIAVLITAPVGCVLIALTGPRLLQKDSSPEIIMQLEEEFPNGEGIDPAESTFDLIARRQSIKKNDPQDGENAVHVEEVKVDPNPK